jgi:hypothetical protein
LRYTRTRTRTSFARSARARRWLFADAGTGRSGRNIKSGRDLSSSLLGITHALVVQVVQNLGTTRTRTSVTSREQNIGILEKFNKESPRGHGNAINKKHQHNFNNRDRRWQRSPNPRPLPNAPNPMQALELTSGHHRDPPRLLREILRLHQLSRCSRGAHIKRLATIAA